MSEGLPTPPSLRSRLSVSRNIAADLRQFPVYVHARDSDRQSPQQILVFCAASGETLVYGYCDRDHAETEACFIRSSIRLEPFALRNSIRREKGIGLPEAIGQQ